MTFTNTSTDIPDELLSAQEEGKVVFFCGAGISYDAGIPVFDGLLDKTAQGLKHELSKPEEILRKEGKFDQLYQSFERDFRDPIRVRKVSANILRPKVDAAGRGVAKHRALLKLAKASDGRTRIVTTNYDNLFDIAQDDSVSQVRSFAAPLLPVPKDYKWDGIVYLHGKLEDKPDDDNLLSLILSSGDFGQAYLTERWAARFVSELFRDHVICFVGYSANDVIMKYMMDALASEEMRGGNRNPVYAFAACKRNHEEECREEWKAKGVTAVPYRKTPKKGHAELTSVLQEWARFHETGRIDKAAVVKRLLMRLPDTVSGDGKQAIERVLWALKDKIGATALPYPPTPETAQWLEHIPGDMLKEKTGTQLIAWIGAHANHPEALQWCVRNERYCNLEQINMLCGSVNGVNVANRTLSELWRLFLSDFRLQEAGRHEYFDWIAARKNAGVLTAGLRQKFKAMVQPRLVISASPNPLIQDVDNMRRYFEWGFILGDNLSFFEEQEAESFLSELLPELTVALVDACEMLQSLDAQDFSYMHLPDLSSPDDHAYSKQDWYYLLVLLKYAIMGMAKRDEKSALAAWKGWRGMHYPAFYRLVLWAGASLDAISAHEVIKWLRRNEDPIWIENSYRELLEFLDVKGAKADSKDLERLQRMLLLQGKGCSSGESEVATRLEHLKNGGAKLNRQAEEFLERFAAGHSDWLRRDRRWDGAYVSVDDLCEPEVSRHEVRVPRNVAAAKEYIEQSLLPKDRQSFLNGFGDWLKKQPGESFRFLLDIGRQTGYWPDAVWDEVFSSLGSKDEIGAAIGSLTTEDVVAFPVEVLDSVRIRFSFWAQSVSKLEFKSAPFFELCRKFLLEVSAKKDVVTTENANAPYEVVAEAVLRKWYDEHPKVGSGIGEPYRGLFTEIAKGETRGLSYARRPLLRQLSGLYAVDPSWTKSSLLPLLSWESDEKTAADSWNYAIMMARYEPSLMKLIWSDFAELGKRYDGMREISRSWFAALLFYHATHIETTVDKKACGRIIRALPSTGREELARQVYLSLQTAGDRADAVWTNDIAPFLRDVWPSEAKYMTRKVFTHFANGVAHLNVTFPEAVDLIGMYPVEVRHLPMVHVLLSSKRGEVLLCDKYPEASLKFLAMLTDFFGISGRGLNKCLDEIAASPQNVRKLEETTDFKRLREVASAKV